MHPIGAGRRLVLAVRIRGGFALSELGHGYFCLVGLLQFQATLLQFGSLPKHIEHRLMRLIKTILNRLKPPSSAKLPMFLHMDLHTFRTQRKITTAILTKISNKLIGMEGTGSLDPLSLCADVRVDLFDCWQGG